MRAECRTEKEMLFNSFAFAAFFSVVVAIYFACRRRLAWQNGMLKSISFSVGTVDIRPAALEAATISITMA